MIDLLLSGGKNLIGFLFLQCGMYNQILICSVHCSGGLGVFLTIFCTFLSLLATNLMTYISNTFEIDTNLS